MAQVHITFQYSHHGNKSSQEQTIPETDIPYSNMALVHITFQFSHHGNKSSQEQIIPETDIPHSSMSLVHIIFTIVTMVTRALKNKLFRRQIYHIVIWHWYTLLF